MGVDLLAVKHYLSPDTSPEGTECIVNAWVLGSFLQLKCDPLGNDAIGHPMVAYNFTDRVRANLQAAREIAGHAGHRAITPEHILLGLLRGRDGETEVILQRAGADAPALIRRLGVVPLPGTEPSPGADLSYIPAAKDVLEVATVEAQELGHSYAGTGHLLLALTQSPTLAGRMLREAGLAPDRVRSVVAEVVGHGPAMAGPGPKAGDGAAATKTNRIALVVSVAALLFALAGLVFALQALQRSVAT